MKLLSYSNKNTGLEMFIQSARARDWQPVLLGVLNEAFFWEVRMKAVRDYCRGRPSDELIVFTDAFDVLFLESPERVEETFAKFQKEIVFSAETNCWPMANLASRYPASSSSFRYLNAGTYMGYAGAIASMFDEMELDGAFNLYDQLQLTKWFLANQDKSALDTRCQIFQCLFEAEHLVELRDGRLFNKQSSTFPAILHCNGNHGARRTENYYRLLFKDSH